MKKEDMMKAATLYADDVCKGPRYRWGHEQVAMVDFIEGAKWRINSVWHDASEMPEKKFALVEYDCFPKGHLKGMDTWLSPMHGKLLKASHVGPIWMT